MSDRDKVFDFMTKAGVLFLATVKGDKPKNRPIGFRMLVDNQIYFLTGEHKEVYVQMMKNTNVEFVGRVDNEFIRYYGRVVFDEDEDKSLLKKAFEVMPMLEKLYGEDSELKPVIFHVDKATAEIRDMFGVKQTYNFLN
ncbi:MAG: pyridoxamine 5'-phosphate oxidase family protein [Methanosphaera sp.]|nr:pyridoxamine 5'-phosphate oxidase family protein [Methanosphaera sp.]